MSRTPNIIFRELYRKAKKAKDVTIAESTEIPPIVQYGIEDGCCYVPYTKIIATFLKEGYCENKARKHVDAWIANDVLTMRYTPEGYRLVGLYGEDF